MTKASSTVSPKRPAKPRKLSGSRSTTFHRDWMSMLLPIFVTVFISCLAQLGAGLYQAATFKAQVNHIDEHQKDLDSALKADSDAIKAMMTRLPIEYVPRVEIERNRETTKEMRDMENTRMQNMETKLDMILANQNHR